MVATGGLGGLLVLAGLVSGMWLRGPTARPARRRHPEVVADRLPAQPRMHVNDAPSATAATMPSSLSGPLNSPAVLA